MKNSAFTLIELLGVMVILALILTLITPRIINSIKDTTIEVDNLTEKLIYSSTENLINDNKNLFKKVNGNTYCVQVKELVDIDYIKAPKINNKDITDTMSVKVTYNNGFNYELVKKENCEEISETQILYSIKYTSINSDNLPKIVKKGESIKIDLSLDSPERIIVKIDNNEITNYTYTNHILTLKNVYGNVEIINNK